MHSAWDPFIGYCVAAYFILSFVSAPFMVGYAVYKVLSKINSRRND